MRSQAASIIQTAALRPFYNRIPIYLNMLRMQGAPDAWLRAEMRLIELRGRRWHEFCVDGRWLEWMYMT